MNEVVEEKQSEDDQLVDEEQEKSEVFRYKSELEEKIRERNELREKNLNRQNPPDSYFFKLDSSLKKNTAFVKKLKQFTAQQLDGLLKDINGLNLTKYISEVAQAIVEAKLKMSDIPAAIILSSNLHQIYSDFSTHFFENWQKVLAIKPGEKVKNASKMRVDLKFYCELLNVGIFPHKTGLPLLGQLLTNLINQDKEEHSNLSIILSFCKHVGEEFAGLVSSRILTAAKKHNIELPSSTLLPVERQQNLRVLLREYHQTLCKHLKKEHRELQDAERWKRRAMESRGEISNDKREQLELLTSNFEKLYQSTITFCDLINEKMPELPKEVEAPTEGMVIENEDIGDVILDPWGDEDTKSFYVDLPDLRQYLPNYQFAQKESSEPLPEVEIVTEEALDDENSAEPELTIEDQEMLKEIEEEASKPDIEKSAIEKPADADDEEPTKPDETEIKDENGEN
jgi:regulator of nonsense transcripts 2